jgi:hypothetical protein
MYFINLVKLASYYIKNNIPLDKEILTTCTEQIQDRDNPRHATQWLDIIGASHIEFSQNMIPHLELLSPILATSLSIDAWWSGVTYEVLDNKNYLDGLIYIIHATENKHIVASHPISEEEYHNLQQSLYNFTKALLSYLTKKNQNQTYSTELFDMWLRLH